MSEVIPRMPRCNLHSHYYPVGGFCHYCQVEVLNALEFGNGTEPAPVGLMTVGHEKPPAAKFTVPLKLCSMKNSKIQARGKVFKNPEVVAFERDFAMLVPSECRNLALGSAVEPLSATITVFYPSRRSDLDCALVYDCLQTSGVVSNDRYIQEKHEYAKLDKVNPRVEIELRSVSL